MNAAEIIKKDLDAIYIGNLSTVDDDLTLPENAGTRLMIVPNSGQFGMKIMKWLRYLRMRKDRHLPY